MTRGLIAPTITRGRGDPTTTRGWDGSTITERPGGAGSPSHPESVRAGAALPTPANGERRGRGPWTRRKACGPTLFPLCERCNTIPGNSWRRAAPCPAPSRSGACSRPSGGPRQPPPLSCALPGLYLAGQIPYPTPRLPPPRLEPFPNWDPLSLSPLHLPLGLHLPWDPLPSGTGDGKSMIVAQHLARPRAAEGKRGREGAQGEAALTLHDSRPGT